jgi:hypothetical protein
MIDFVFFLRYTYFIKSAIIQNNVFKLFCLAGISRFYTGDEATLLLAAQHMESLISKLRMVIEIMEQFPTCEEQSASGSPANVIKVQLKRHPSSINLKEYFGGDIEIEPHALVLSIEKFLIVRDYGRVRRDDFDDCLE